MTCPECLTEDEWYGYAKRTAWERKAETNDEIDGTFKSYLKRASIYPEFSKVVGFAYMYWEEKEVMAWEDERDLLLKINGVFKSHECRIGWFNIYSYAIPFLWKRMIINQINPQNKLCISYLKPRDLDSYLVDVMNIWKQTSFTCSLDLLSLSLLGDKPNTDWIGEFVGGAVNSENWDWVKYYVNAWLLYTEKCYDAIMYPEQRNEEVNDAKEIAEKKMGESEGEWKLPF